MVFEQRAAGAVHDRLRAPVVPDENSTNSGWFHGNRGSSARTSGLARPPAISAANVVVRIAAALIGIAAGTERDHVAKRREAGAQLAQPIVDRPGLAILGVRRMCEQQGWLELPEPVERRIEALVGRGRRPGGADRQRRQARHDGLDAVRRHGDHPIAGGDPERAKLTGHRQHLVAKLAARQRDPRAGLIMPGDRAAIVGALRAQQISDVAQGERRKERRLLARLSHADRLEIPGHVERGPLDEQSPEPAELADRELVK